MNLFERLGAANWAKGFRPISCGNSICRRWVTSRQREVSHVGVTMAGNWYCSYRCIRPAAQVRMTKLLRDVSPHRYESTSSLLGLTLVRQGLLSDAQYKKASKIERESGEELGEIVVRFGWLTERQVTDVRATQWNCPVFPCSSFTPNTDLGLPSLLTHRYAMLPLHFAANTLFVGFAYEVDYAALYAIESITGCSTRPCMIMPSEFKHIASQTAAIAVSQEWDENSFGTSAEMTESLCRQGASMNADQVMMVRCGGLIWCRTKAADKKFDLLFHCQSS